MTMQDNGNIGIGTTAPRSRLQVRSLTAIDEGTTGAGAWANFGSNAFFDGTWRRIDSTKAGVNLHMNPDGGGQEFRFLRQEADGTNQRNIAVIGSSRSFIAEGNVGIGTTGPQGKLDVNGDIRAGNSDIYFTRTDHNHTGIGNTAGFAAIENGANFGGLMILGRTVSTNPLRRVVKLWDYLQINGGLDVTGNVGIGVTGGLSRILQVQGSEIHSGGGGAGYSFSNRETATFVESPSGGERWVWYASGGRARLWSGVDRFSVALDPTFQTTVTIGPGTNGRLKVRHIDGKHWQNDNNDGLYLNWNTGQPVNIGQNLSVAGNAFKPGGGSWSVASDIRLKESVSTLKGALDKLLRLRGVKFEWKEPEKHANLTGSQMGLIAQEVEGVFPEWIDADSEGHKYLTVRGFEALTVEAIRELKAELEAVRAALGKE
jgi:hypothetical protein